MCVRSPPMAPGTGVQDLSSDEAGNKHTHVHTHTLAGTTHLVGFMRGLLPKRKDGSSSATVPFRSRNFSVRSNPARTGFEVRSKPAQVLMQVEAASIQQHTCYFQRPAQDVRESVFLHNESRTRVI